MGPQIERFAPDHGWTDGTIETLRKGRASPAFFAFAGRRAGPSCASPSGQATPPAPDRPPADAGRSRHLRTVVPPTAGPFLRREAVRPEIREKDLSDVPAQISHVLGTYEKSVVSQAHGTVSTSCAWYQPPGDRQNPSAQPSLRGSEPPMSTPRGSMRMACPPPMGATARSMTWPMAASCAAIASGTAVSSCNPAP